MKKTLRYLKGSIGAKFNDATSLLSKPIFVKRHLAFQPFFRSFTYVIFGALAFYVFFIAFSLIDFTSANSSSALLLAFFKNLNEFCSKLISRLI